MAVPKVGTDFVLLHPSAYWSSGLQPWVPIESSVAPPPPVA